MKKRIKNITIGILISCTLVGNPVFANSLSQKIDVVLNRIEVQVDGEKLETNTILYNGTTYLPIRKVAEVVGRKIDWNQNTMTVNIFEETTISTIENNIKVGENLSVNNEEYKEFFNMFNFDEIGFKVYPNEHYYYDVKYIGGLSYNELLQLLNSDGKFIKCANRFINEKHGKGGMDGKNFETNVYYYYYFKNNIMDKTIIGVSNYKIDNDGNETITTKFN